MICSDIKEYNVAGDIKTPSLCCVPFIYKKKWDIKSAGQYMNYQSFTNLQLKVYLKTLSIA